MACPEGEANTRLAGRVSAARSMSTAIDLAEIPSAFRWSGRRPYFNCGHQTSPRVSLAGRVRTLRAFGGWVFREVGLPIHPLGGLLTPMVPDVLVPSLRDPEMRALLAAAASSKGPLRDQAIVSLLLDAGIRPSELVGIRVGDLDFVEGRCRIRGKGARERMVPVGGRCRRSLRAWLAARGRVDAAAPLFVGRGGVPLPRRTIRQLVRRLAGSAGITERCSSHILRHSFARDS